MDTDSLRVFLSLCETENMRDTAALERVHQSNVSRALKRLEVDLGVELFRRHGRRLALNRQGRLFRDHAQRAVVDLDRGRRRVEDDVDAEHGVIHLGFLQSVAREVVPDIIRDFRRVVPAGRFELRQGFARDLYARIEESSLDAAIVTPPRPGATAGFAFAALVHQQLCLAVPPGHRLAAVATPTLDVIASEPFIAFNLSTDLRGVVDRLLADAGVEPRVAFESGEIDTVRGLIGAGLGVGVLPRPAVPEHDDLVYVDLTPASTRTIGVAWHLESQTPAVTRFVDHLSTRGASATVVG